MLLKLSVTESVLLVDKPSKSESLLRISSLAAMPPAVMDVMVDTHQVLSAIGREMVLLPDGSTTPPIGANPTPLLLATTTPLVNMNHAVPQNQPPPARIPALPDTLDLMPLTNGMLNLFTQFHQLLKKFKLKS